VRLVTIRDAARQIQFSYPQIYFACHTRHQRGRSTDTRLSPRDGAILVHLDERTPVELLPLARHLGLAASTLSEAVSRLERLGFLSKATRPERDRRRVGICLTRKGADAVQASSVLETARLEAVLKRLRPAERDLLCGTLSQFARACGGLHRASEH
jgi:DNA-binding MarR family transcriptional regulator